MAPGRLRTILDPTAAELGVFPYRACFKGLIGRLRHGSQRAIYTLGNDTVHPRMENYRRDGGLFLLGF